MSETPEKKVARPAHSNAPLAGRSIIVTRTREQAHALAAPLEALGAEIVAMPVISIVDPEDWGPVDDALGRLADYDWVVFTSTNAVDRFVGRMRSLGSGPAERLSASQVHVAAVGSATAEYLAEHEIEVDLVPEDFRAEGLLDAFRNLETEGTVRVLIPRAMEAREILPDTLCEMGWAVDVVPVYRTVPATPERRAIARVRSGAVDAVTFTSGSTVRNFLALLETAGVDPAQALAGIVLASIGPVTTAALERRGFKADVEAPESTMPSLAATLAAYFVERQGE